MHFAKKNEKQLRFQLLDDFSQLRQAEHFLIDDNGRFDGGGRIAGILVVASILHVISVELRDLRVRQGLVEVGLLPSLEEPDSADDLRGKMDDGRCLFLHAPAVVRDPEILVVVGVDLDESARRAEEAFLPNLSGEPLIPSQAN